jgi:hypothetical protein
MECWLRPVLYSAFYRTTIEHGTRVSEGIFAAMRNNDNPNPHFTLHNTGR